MSTPKLRCTNCPARNRHVKEVVVKKDGHRIVLCPECHAALKRVLLEEDRVAGMQRELEQDAPTPEEA